MKLTGAIDTTKVDADGHYYQVQITALLPNGVQETLAAQVDDQDRERITQLCKTHPEPNFLRRLRQERGLSQVEMSRQLGITQATLSHWESGAHRPMLRYAVTLARFFDVAVSDLGITIHGGDELPATTAGATV